MKSDIYTKAMKSGFDAIGFSSPLIGEINKRRFIEFINNCEYGNMDFFIKTKNLRLNPKLVFTDIESVIIVGINYLPYEISEIQNIINVDKNNAYISMYSHNKDYHKIIKKKLITFSKWLSEKFSCQVKCFVDTGPVMEKAFAANSNIGWQGKNTKIVSKKFGQFLFLGVIFTSLKIKPDKAAENLCAECSICIEKCPTGALYKPYKLDPRRCISYLTIEHKGLIPVKYRKFISNRIFGCDNCSIYCPHNINSIKTDINDFLPQNKYKSLSLGYLLSCNKDEFNRLFKGSAIKRTGYERILRNVIIACGNSGNIIYLDRLKKLINNDSIIISDTAKWAVSIMNFFRRNI